MNKATISPDLSTVDIRGSNRTHDTCPSAHLSEDLLKGYYASIATSSSLFCLALIGNICVILAVFWRRRKKMTRMHTLILHLAVADILVALFQLLPEFLTMVKCGFHASDGVCRLVRYLQVVGMYGSSYVLVCTAMDRYLAIKSPLKTFNQSKKRVHCTILFAWLLSFSLAIPQLFLFGIDDDRPLLCRMKEITNTGIKIYVTWYFISILAFPFAMLAYFYGMIALLIYKNVKNKKAAAEDRILSTGRSRNGGFSLRASNVEIAGRAKIKTVKMTFVIVLLYAICYAPFFTVTLLRGWGWTGRGMFVNVFSLLASLNSCVNPWIYMFFSGHLLKELTDGCLCRKKLKEEHSQVSQRGYTTTSTHL